MTNDIDPEDPRPEGHYPRFRNNEWHYVPDELAQTISLGPGGDMARKVKIGYSRTRRRNEIQMTERRCSSG